MSAVSRPFAINTGSPIAGTDQYGNIAVGVTAQDYASGIGGVQWYMGPDESLGYIIGGQNGGEPTFWRSADFTDQALVNLVNDLPARNGQTPFTNVNDAKTWLSNTGHFLSVPLAQVGNSALSMSTSSTSGNLAYIVYNFDSRTYQIVDMGINPGDGYYIDQIYPLTGKGYMISITYDGGYSGATFIDAYGKTVHQYTCTPTSNIRRDDLNGRMLYYWNKDTGELFYFDGHSVNTYTYDTTVYSNNSLYWYWDGVSADNYLMLSLGRGDNTQVEILTINNGNSYTLLTYDPSVYQSVDVFTSTTSHYFSTVYRSVSGYYTTLKILDYQGNVIHSVDLTGLNYNNYNLGYFAVGRFMYCFNTASSTDPYFILSYEENGDHLITTTHAQGPNYVYFSLYYGSVDYNSNQDSDTAGILFYSSPYNGGPNNEFAMCSYAEFVFFSAGATAPNIYTINNTGTPNIGVGFPNIFVSGTLFIPILNANNSIDILTLANNDTNVALVSMDSSNVSGIGDDSFGNRYVYYLVLNNGTTSVNLILAGGNIGDSMTINANSWNSRVRYKVYYINDPTNALGWYVNDSVTTFQSVGYYDSLWTAVGYQEANRYSPSGILLYNSSSSSMGVITANAAPNFITLPANGGLYNFQPNDRYVLYSYLDPLNSNLFTIQYYNTSGVLQTSAVTEFSFATWASIAGNNGFTLQQAMSENFYRFVTPTGIDEVTGLTSYYNWIIFNDWIWWNN